MEVEQHQDQEQPEEEEKEVEEEEEDEERGVESDSSGVLRPSFPLGRVKTIMKLDREIKKVNSEALFLVSLSTELFLGFLAGRAKVLAVEKKKKTVRPDHLRSAVRAHPPTSDFLLDSLQTPPPSQTLASHSEAQTRPPRPVKPLPPGTRRIDDFLRKAPSEAPE